MNKDQGLRIFRYILVIGVGAIASWNISFFRPFTAEYPPSVAYKIIHIVNGVPDSVLAAPGRQYGKSAFGEFWLGKHYRSLWTTPVKVKVLHLDQKGLQIKKRGGGMQTTSFTLIDKAGKEYSLRSVDKDPISVIPTFLWRTVFGNFIRDQVSATDPYALSPVLALTEKAGIIRHKAELVFVLPNDPAFKKFNLKNSGFYNLSSDNGIPVMAESVIPGKVYSSEGMLAALAKDKGARIDTARFLKCRLFDLLIGDWDRHAGQWDWMAFSSGNHTVFKPIPKDRDQAFGMYADGVLPYILSRDFAVRKITSFTPQYHDIAGFSENGSNLDSRFLRNIEAEKVTLTVNELQSQLSDVELRKALKKYPSSIYRLVADRHFETLQARRDNLPAGATEFLMIINTRPEPK